MALSVMVSATSVLSAFGSSELAVSESVVSVIADSVVVEAVEGKSEVSTVVVNSVSLGSNKATKSAPLGVILSLILPFSVWNSPMLTRFLWLSRLMLFNASTSMAIFSSC